MITKEQTADSANPSSLSPSDATGTLEAFVAERSKKISEISVEAQKLVNLYRQLDALGKDYVPVFDKMLLSSTPEIRLAMSNLSGGDMVRTYLKFLQGRLEKDGVEAESEEEISMSENSAFYLPEPDEVPAYRTGGAVAVTDGTVNSDMLSSILGAVVEAQQKSMEQQNTFLQKALMEMRESMAKGSGGAGINLEALQTAQQKSFNDMVERLVGEQARLLSDSLSEVLKNTQEIAREQVQDIVSQIQSTNALYPHVEEVAPSTPIYRPKIPMETLKKPAQAPEAPKKTMADAVTAPRAPKAPRSVAPQIPDDVEILSEVDLPNSEDGG